MIKFFRKIRQQLLTENKFSKYLIYAIGEIILVVIGILIAVNLNNRNEQRKQKARIELLFEDIMEELVSDIKKTTNIIHYFKDRDSTIQLVLSDRLTFEDDKRFYFKDNIDFERHEIFWLASNKILTDNLYYGTLVKEGNEYIIKLNYVVLKKVD